MQRRLCLALLPLLPCFVIAASLPEGPFDTDPEHAANRVYRHLYSRTAADGEVYNLESLDPVFLPQSKFLMEGESHRQALALLDDFLKSQATLPLQGPLRRAVLQHDLWGVFGTSAGWVNREVQETPDGRVVATQRRFDGGDAGLARPKERRALQRRLALAMRSLALTAEEIEALPDNLAAAVKGGALPTAFDPKDPTKPFLPSDLLVPDSPWVAVSNPIQEDRLAAPEHVAFTKGRSVFTVFLRLSGGRRETQAYLKTLAEAANSRQGLPQLPEGAQTALLRQMLLIDDQGKLRVSRLTESLLLRVYHRNDLGHPFAFKLCRADLFASRNGGLHAVTATEPSYFDFQTRGGDPFEVEPKKRRLPEALLGTCTRCHDRHEGRGIFSVATLWTGGQEGPGLAGSDPKQQAQATVVWHHRTHTWGLLQRLWKSRTDK